MLINLSNHPATDWPVGQKTAATQFGEIRDIPFPNIPPDWDTEPVKTLAYEYLDRIKLIERETGSKPVVHIAGEPVFCFFLIQMLLKENILCITSTTERIVEEESNIKTTIFKFKRFRKYSDV